MSYEKSDIPGGVRVTQHVDGCDILGNPTHEVRTDDYVGGERVSGTFTDNNGDQWNVNSAGCTTHIIGNDGRLKD